MTFKIICDGCNAEVNEGISPRAQSAGAVSRRRKLLGGVIHPAAPAGAEGGAARGRGGIETAPTSEHVAGMGSNPYFPERGGAWSRVLSTRPPRPATALIRGRSLGTRPIAFACHNLQ